MTALATSTQHHEVQRVGLPIERYERVRRSGASHDDVMEAHALGADLRVYAYVRTVVATHGEALREAGASTAPETTEAGRLGVSAADVAALRATYRSATDAYHRALERNEMPARQAAPIPRVADYLSARRGGLGHDDAIWFATEASTLALPPARRDVDMWARCVAAGLDRRHLFRGGRSGRAPLKGHQLAALHAGLFVARSMDHPTLSQQELMWVAIRSNRGPVDMQAYAERRRAGARPRRALRMAQVASGPNR